VPFGHCRVGLPTRACPSNVSLIAMLGLEHVPGQLNQGARRALETDAPIGARPSTHRGADWCFRGGMIPAIK